MKLHKHTAGDPGIVAIAIVSGRLTDDRALKALTPEARKYDIEFVRASDFAFAFTVRQIQEYAHRGVHIEERSA